MQNAAACFRATLKETVDPGSRESTIHVVRDTGKSTSSSASSRQDQHQIKTVLPRALFSHVVETSESRDPGASWVAWSLV